MIALVHRHDRRFPRERRQHWRDQRPGALEPQRFARASPQSDRRMTGIHIPQLAFFRRDQRGDQRDESIRD